MSTQTPSLFETLAALSKATYPLAIANPNDLVEVHADDDQLIRYEVKEGAPTTELMIRPLSPLELEEADKILAAAGAPPVIMKTNPDGSKIPAGRDEEDPIFRAALEPLLRKRQVFIVLKGCPQLHDSAPGSTIEEKITHTMKELPDVLLKFIGSRVFKFSFPAGDLSDFFSTRKSEETQS